MLAKTKLRPLIHQSYEYLITKFYEEELALITVSVNSLQEMINKVEAEAKGMGRFPDGLRYSIGEVNYVLHRVLELEADDRIRYNDDIMVFGDALKYRFNKLLKMLEEIDAQIR